MASRDVSGPDTTVQDGPVELSASPVEMSHLQQTVDPEPTPHIIHELPAEDIRSQPPTTAPASVVSPSDLPVHPSAYTSDAPLPPTPILTRQQTEALGPATEAPILPPITAGPTLSITLMLTTGARHPYKVDQKYLTNRKVDARSSDGSFDPRELSGYKLKELIWTDWRGEWEPRPASPSSIRLIIMGKLLDDKKMLKEYPFNLETTNILHMTIKPADFDDDEAGGGKAGAGKSSSLRARDGDDGRGAGCRCVIL